MNYERQTSKRLKVVMAKERKNHQDRLNNYQQQKRRLVFFLTPFLCLFVIHPSTVILIHAFIHPLYSALFRRLLSVLSICLFLLV